MKLFHLSDLHIGKKLNEFSLEEDQKHIFKEILTAVDSEHPDGVMISGDIYDSTSPATGSFSIFDDFITELSKRRVHVYIISGNHDSNEKLGFGKRLFKDNGIDISHEFNGKMETVEYNDGTIFYLLPFVRPSNVRKFFPDAKIESYEDAVRTIIDNTNICGRTNILLTHQYVIGKDSETIKSESEVGTSEPISASIFDKFDYVALGHIHKPQDIVKGKIRYCGTPLKYSKSEADNKNSITVVDIENGKVDVSTIPLKPLRNIRVIRGPIDSLIEEGKKDTDRNDFIYAEITEPATNAMERLRDVYPNVANLIFVTEGERKDRTSVKHTVGKLDPFVLFTDLYNQSNDKEMTDAQKKIVKDVIDEEEVSL